MNITNLFIETVAGHGDIRTSTVDRLSCQVAIDETTAALRSASSIAKAALSEGQFINWYDRVVYPVDVARRADLLRLFGGEPLTRATANGIKAWTAANPVELGDAGAIAAAKRALELTRQKSAACWAALQTLQVEDRFGWDHANDCEDTEYSKTNQASYDASAALTAAERDLSLAQIGITEDDRK